MERLFTSGSSPICGRRGHATCAPVPEGVADLAIALSTCAGKIRTSRDSDSHMRTSPLLRTLVVMLALEWELCNQDPFIFCYRIGVEPLRAVAIRIGGRR